MHGWKTIKDKLLPRSLFGRSLMIILMPLLLLQMIVAFVFFDRHWDKMTEKLVFSLAGEVKLAREMVAGARAGDARARAVALLSGTLDLAVSLEKGDAVAQAVRPPSRLRWFNVDRRLAAALERKLDGAPFVISGSESGRWFEVRMPVEDGMLLRISASEKRLVSPTTYIFILWMIASALVLFGIAITFMRNQMRPIRRLAVAAEKLGKGQDVPTFKIEGAREVRQAGIAFLEMKERLKRQIEQRTAMLAGVSHDLRTPLTRMKLQIAMTRDGSDLQSLREDIEEMEKMIEGYLAFARGEAGEAPEATDLRTVLERVMSNARRQGHAVREDLGDQRFSLRVRPLAVERALSNVVANACKYGENVWVRARMQDYALEITVDDDGPGIPPALREEVFRPFYRLEKSRNKKTGGIGLGLSIARDVIHGHGGEIYLEDGEKGGLRVVVRLPV